MSTVNHEQGATALGKSSYQSERHWQVILLLVIGMFAATLPWPGGLGQLPLQNVLKNKLHLNATKTSSFFLYGSLFWYIKPIAGILTDAFPLFGTRRRHYLLFSSSFAALAWIALGLVEPTFRSLLLAVLFINMFVVMISTVIGAFLVETGQSRDEVGKFTAIRMITCQ